METWEIIILVLFIILLLVGLGVGVYFVWREDQKKNPNTGPTGGTGTTGTTGTTGGTGPTGTTGGTGTFSISPQVAPTMFLTYDPNNPITVPGDPNAEIPLVTTNGSTLRCADYQWANFSFEGVPSVLGLRNQTIVQPGYTRPQVVSASQDSLTGRAILLSTADIDLLANWTYTSEKRWCSEDVYCLYYNSDNTITIENINNANLTLSNFIWNNSSSPPSTCIQ